MAQITSIEALRERLPEPNPLTRTKVRKFLDGQAKAFVARAPFLLLSTVDAGGAVEVSPKGDEPGFVHVQDDTTLLVPDRAGNNLAFGHINILSNPNVGLIFLAPGTGETLRVSGRATLHDDEDLCARLSSRGKPAKLVMKLAVDRAYFHCARAILRSNLWKPDAWAADPLKVSFGKLVMELTNADAATAKAVDDSVGRSYAPENL
ncbi:MAG TPA: MSMEG_1061 family FMN-dependent PPOX-type flavoprotein [Rhizomicrobium sp.]|nr:MSMEG_1061 family FMN-dependent PPOX-type flavoprotein [Rhizomicrobium sp.]